MKNTVEVEVDVRLLQYILAFLKTDHTSESGDFYDSTWKVGISDAAMELEQILTAQSGYVAPGQRQIQHNPNRTDVGMGAVLNTNSEFL